MTCRLTHCKRMLLAKDFELRLAFLFYAFDTQIDQGRRRSDLLL